MEEDRRRASPTNQFDDGPPEGDTMQEPQDDATPAQQAPEVHVTPTSGDEMEEDFEIVEPPSAEEMAFDEQARGKNTQLKNHFFNLNEITENVLFCHNSCSDTSSSSCCSNRGSS